MRRSHPAPVWLVITFLGALLCRPAPGGAADVALVVGVNGQPVVTRTGKTEPLQRGAVVAIGDVIETNADSKLKVLLADDSVLAIGPKTRIVLDDFALGAQSRTVRLRVLVGRFKLAIAAFLGGSTTYEIRTPTAVAGVRGTVLWGDTDLDAVCALDGRVELRTLSGNAGPMQLTAGECAQRMATGTPAPFKPSAADLAAYLKDVTLD